MTALTHGHLLGGRVRYAQPAAGFRSGIEPVLLAAAIPVRAGEAVLEAGSGAGAGLLCLAHRVPGVRGFGIERDPGLVAIARANAADNGLAGLCFCAADLAAPVAALPGQRFDHAFANPPYHPHDGSTSPHPGRQAAKTGAPGLLAAWCHAMAERLLPRGTLTLILPAGILGEAAAALREAGCGGLTLYPLWPRAGAMAKLILLQAGKDSRTPDRVAPGLVLHGQSGFTPAAEAILRDGAELALGI